MSASLTAPAERLVQLLDVQAVADMCDCSPRTVYRLSDSGRMPAPLKLGKVLVRWNRAVIEKWIESGCPAVRHVSAKGAAR